MFNNIAIVASNQDTAGLNIKRSLIKLFPFKKQEGEFDNNEIYSLEGLNEGREIKLYTINTDSINAENIDKKINAELFVFITRHKSKSGIPSLCVHTQGNIGKAMLGGRDKSISVSPACYIKQALINLNELNSLNFDVVQEVTHHGPEMNKPSFFIEIGSTEKEWSNEKAGLIVATALMKTLQNPKPCVSTIGIGGPHTTTNFKKIILNTNIGLGHVCAHYNLPELDKSMIKQMINKTMPKPTLIILDWKGMKKEKGRIVGIVEEISKEDNIKVMRTKDFKQAKDLNNSTTQQ